MQPTYNQQPRVDGASSPSNLPNLNPVNQGGEIALPAPGYNAMPVAPAEAAPAPNPGPLAAAQPLLDPAMPVPPAMPTAASLTAVNSSMPAMADDSELIEKEWVSKAKQIINQTKDDPYTQSRELNKVRAAYIKKRYNKDMKLPE